MRDAAVLISGLRVALRALLRWNVLRARRGVCRVKDLSEVQLFYSGSPT